jgi:hypothetical protein
MYLYDLYLSYLFFVPNLLDKNKVVAEEEVAGVVEEAGEEVKVDFPSKFILLYKFRFY